VKSFYKKRANSDLRVPDWLLLKAFSKVSNFTKVANVFKNEHALVSTVFFWERDDLPMGSKGQWPGQHQFFKSTRNEE